VYLLLVNRYVPLAGGNSGARVLVNILTFHALMALRASAGPFRGIAMDRLMFIEVRPAFSVVVSVALSAAA